MPASYQIVLNTKRGNRFDGRHPWVLSQSIVEPTAAPPAGEVVELVHSDGKWIGRGIYNPNSRIRVRLYQWDSDSCLDTDWISVQLEKAIQLRERWQAQRGELDAVRLVNSEGDGLSGLIVDRFGDYLVVQFTALAMHQFADFIVQWLTERLSPAAIQTRVETQTARQEGMEAVEAWRFGDAPSSPVLISENDVKLEVDLQTGQKTGYYLDQRFNRLRGASWAAEGELLDVCCYHAGFSLAARRWGQAGKITAIDSSRPALERADRNIELNGVENIDLVQADCFDFLEDAVNEGKKFQTVILDPPRMAGSRQQINSALRAYHRLNLAAIRLLEPDGILVSCSCSGRVHRDDLLGVVSSAAKRARRRVQLVESHGADVDHPIDVNCPESEYLKCLICRAT